MLPALLSQHWQVDAAVVWYWGPVNQVDCSTICASLPTSTGCDSAAFALSANLGYTFISSTLPNAVTTACPATALGSTVCTIATTSLLGGGNPQRPNAPFYDPSNPFGGTGRFCYVSSVASATCASVAAPSAFTRRFCPCTVPSLRTLPALLRQAAPPVWTAGSPWASRASASARSLHSPCCLRMHDIIASGILAETRSDLERGMQRHV